jgi:hypothetical protein
MITRLNAALGDLVGTLPKTLFFEHRTLAELAGRLTRDHGEACRRWTGLGHAPAAAAPSPVLSAPRPAKMSAAEPIAIIGMASTYPGAADLDGFGPIWRQVAIRWAKSRRNAGVWTGSSTPTATRRYHAA